jgi:hypothetical protein
MVKNKQKNFSLLCVSNVFRTHQKAHWLFKKKKEYLSIYHIYIYILYNIEYKWKTIEKRLKKKTSVKNIL